MRTRVENAILEGGTSPSRHEVLTAALHNQADLSVSIVMGRGSRSSPSIISAYVTDGLYEMRTANGHGRR